MYAIASACKADADGVGPQVAEGNSRYWRRSASDCFYSCGADRYVRGYTLMIIGF